MGNGSSGTCSFGLAVLARAVVVLLLMAIPALAQRAVSRDPAEPRQGKPLLARPAGVVARQAVDEKSMRALIGKLVACGRSEEHTSELQSLCVISYAVF